MAVIFIGGAVIFIKGAIISVGGAIISIKGAVISIEGAVTSISKGSLSIGGGLFEITKIRVMDNIKGVNKYNLRQQLIIYKLKCPLLLIYSLIFASNYSIRLSL